MSEIDSKAVARRKVERALNLIEQAQTALSMACGELCPLLNAADQWKDVGDRMDDIKALWHRVNETIPRARIDLDSDAKRALAQKKSEGVA